MRVGTICQILLTTVSALGTVQAVTLPSQAILSGGCCPGAAWAPDSDALLFLDGPPARASTGIYTVPAGGGAVTRRFSVVAFYSPALKWAVRPGAGAATTVERLVDGRRFTLPTRGGNVVWNRAETKLTYARSATSGNYDRRVTQVFAAEVFAAPSAVTTVYGGGPIAWLDDRTLLLSGKTTAGARDRALFTLDVQTGARRTLRTALGFRSVQVSPDGRQVAYTISFEGAARSGVWLQATSGGRPVRLPEFGAYQWRDARRLLLIALRTDGGPHVLRQYDAGAGTWATLGDLGDQIRQADWQVSPDGKRVSYLSARDGNVRVLRLP